MKQWQDNMQAMDQLIGEENEEVNPIGALKATSLGATETSSTDASAIASESLAPVSAKPTSISDTSVNVVVTAEASPCETEEHGGGSEY